MAFLAGDLQCYESMNDLMTTVLHWRWQRQ